MHRRLLSTTLALALVAAPATAETVRVTESFDGPPTGHWTGGFIFDMFGFGLREEVVAEGGAKGGGPYLFRFAEEFIPEFHTTEGSDSSFIGNWREMDVRNFKASVKVFQYTDFLPEDHPLVFHGQPNNTRERHVTLMLVRDPDPDTFGDECTVISVGGHHLTSGAPDQGNSYFVAPAKINGEPRGEGWETFHFSVKAASERKPNQWDVPRVDSDINRDGDWDYFDNACPLNDDVAWRYVTEQVDQVILRLADPIGEAFGIGQFWGYGLDEVEISLGE